MVAVAARVAAARGVVDPGQQVLQWGGGPELLLQLQWQRLAESCRRADGARASDWDANYDYNCFNLSGPRKEKTRIKDVNQLFTK
jgi:hypothetical protein